MGVASSELLTAVYRESFVSRQKMCWVQLLQSWVIFRLTGEASCRLAVVRSEPRKALTSGADGLDALTEIIQTGLAYLHSGGILLVEHGYNQATAVAALFKQYGYTDTQAFQDLSGHDRVTLGLRPTFLKS